MLSSKFSGLARLSMLGIGCFLTDAAERRRAQSILGGDDRGQAVNKDGGRHKGVDGDTEAPPQSRKHEFGAWLPRGCRDVPADYSSHLGCRAGIMPVALRMRWRASPTS